MGQLATIGRIEFLYGWAKPVPVNPMQLQLNGQRHPRQLMAIVAAAGPLANFALALLGGYLLSISQATVFLTDFIIINLTLGLFNLLPVPPMDGGRIAVGVLPLPAARWLAKSEKAGIILVLLLLFVLPTVLGQFGVEFRPVPGGDGAACCPGRWIKSCKSRGIAVDSEALVLNLEGFEGPLDLLLELARSQKVDLAKISILALVDQYLAVIEGARRVRLELAADWLVMAAWLTWLKSRLLVPSAGEDEDAEIAAETLAARLIDLQRVRAAAAVAGPAADAGRGRVRARRAGGFHRDRPQQAAAGDERAARRLSGGAAPRRGQAAIPAEADGLFLGAERAGTPAPAGRLEAGLVEPGRVSAAGAGRWPAAQGSTFGNPDGRPWK